jgi:hypothetical protein
MIFIFMEPENLQKLAVEGNSKATKPLELGQ